MMTVSGHSILTNLIDVARFSVQRIMYHIQSILLVLSFQSSRVQGCLEILMNTNPEFKRDEDDWNMSDILSVIEMCSIFKDDYIVYTQSENSSDDREKILNSILWFITQVSQYYNGFNKECMNEVHSITLSLVDGIKKHRELKARVEARKQEKEEAKKMDVFYPTNVNNDYALHEMFINDGE